MGGRNEVKFGMSLEMGERKKRRNWETMEHGALDIDLSVILFTSQIKKYLSDSDVNNTSQPL